MLFDTHAHFDDERFDDDRDEVIRKAHESGVSYILNASSDMDSSRKSMALADKYDFIYAAVGVHPHSAGEMKEDDLEILAGYASHPKVVAIGEIGLDYYYDNSPRNVQKYWFARQIRLAREVGLPVVIHDRDAHEDTLAIIKAEGASEVGGVFHCYTGSVEMAKEVLKNNFYIALGGAVTFKNARKLLDVAKFVPEDRLLIETDCPYMTPEPYRGKRNDSGYVRLVAEKIAELRGVTFEEIAQITAQNARRLFKIT
ncbi:hydrolase TatD [Clostridium thermosuccinogenes]|jgi:TatD DNase family protein|uniref:Hydrolase TatD n=1 Tax=Clostridium thermosuccinogenes TaxID=84032 RepID=A0A2K2FQ71_9CLOT|nr:TatD family hydrolase [Pseudoclostridium thermosuccinogenes]AUS95151.1 hydrolase TatD [Pseudoclostridium thermosuccinogenes]PNT99129.1 hydrolase TatD [Pseudoclostridium thermosuccinogenes]PNU00933.1 hydrolase TatD [Pseudoclostridium thermosuccinogenes]